MIDLEMFLLPEVLILIPFLNVIGLTLKKSIVLEDHLIPHVLGVIGVIFATLILGMEKGFTTESILNGIIQGVLVAGAAVYVHQLKVQSSKERTDK